MALVFTDDGSCRHVRRYPARELADCRKRTVFDVVLNIADCGVPPNQHRPSCGHRIVVETNVTSLWFNLERKDAIAERELRPGLIRLAMYGSEEPLCSFRFLTSTQPR